MPAPADLTPDVLASIHDLELVARLVVEGATAGLHRSPFHGYSAEFSQHRAYHPGDDLRYLDWKVLARTDRLYVKQYRESASTDVAIVVDASASMDFPRPPAVTKFRYAVTLAAALAHLVTSQGDAAGVVIGGAGGLEFVPPRRGRVHLVRLLGALNRARPGGVFPAVRAIARTGALLRRRGVIVLITDGFDVEDEVRAQLTRTLRRGHDVRVLQVLSPEELRLPYDAAQEFEDLETGAERAVDVRHEGPGYRSSLAAFLDAWRRETTQEGIEYALISTDVSPARALRRYLLGQPS